MMPNYKFPLLTTNKSDVAKIKQLRDEESSITHMNNELVKEIWDINAQLNTEELNIDKKNSLEERKKELLEKITSEAYPTKIQELRNRIERLELAVYGFSDINSSSPVETNNNPSV